MRQLLHAAHAIQVRWGLGEGDAAQASQDECSAAFAAQAAYEPPPPPPDKVILTSM